MADLFNNDKEIVLDAQYNQDYDAILQTGLKITDIFFLALILGYRNNKQKKSNLLQDGKVLNIADFSSSQKNLLYGFVLNLPKVVPSDLSNGEKFNKIYEKLIAYANGGIQWLRDNVFVSDLNENGAIIADPQKIQLSLSKFILEELNPQKAPF